MTASLREKHGIYQVVLSWYQNDKRKQKSVSTGIKTQGNNKRKAEEARRQILAEWECKVTENYDDSLFSDYLRRWLEQIKVTIAETTYHAYRHTIERVICPYFEERRIKLVDLKPFHIQDFYTYKLDGGVTGNTIHHYHANIRKALKDAVRIEMILSNPADKVLLPRVDKHHGDFYTQEELRKLVEAVRGSKLEVPVMLAIWFGLRRGEAVGLRWDAISFEAKTLSIKGTVTDKGSGTLIENEVYRTTGKTKTSIRTFPLSQEMITYLKALRRRQAENRILCGRSYDTHWLDFVCVDDVGNLIHLDYVTQAFPRMLKRLGLRKIRYHDLRHTNISLLLEEGASLKDLQEWAGHSNISTTADIYAHVQSQAKQKLLEKMGSILYADPVGHVVGHKKKSS
jgi:integrase